MHVIIVDDALDDFDLYQRILLKIDPSVSLTHIKASKDVIPFFKDASVMYDLVLLDYHMPGQTGLEILKQMKEEGITLQAPLLVLTGQGDERVAVHFMKQGADHYVNKKALTKESLIQAIQEGKQHFLNRKKEEEIQNERRSFAYTVAHDLQNPLKRIQLYSELCLRNMNKAEKYLPRIEEDAQFSVDFIKELLSYVDSGRSCARKETLFMKDVIEKSMDQLSVPIHEKNASIKLVGDFPTIKGAKIPLVQLFQNLIGNSIKYCETTPRIEVKAENKKDEAILSIKDNGIGIPKAMANDIFNPFFRIMSNQEQGHGLGLSIVKNIADQHDATLHVCHPKEGGTEFKIMFPLT